MDNGMEPSGRLAQRTRFADMAARYQNLVYTVCLRMTDNPSDAEDLTQDTFLRAWRARDAFDGANPKSWLCKIAVRLTLDHLKSARARAQTATLEETGLLSGGGDISSLVEERETQFRFQKSLTTLPEKYACLLKKVVSEGKVVTEIALEENIPVRTVETRLYRARKMLKKRWEAE